jgi:Histidine kinase-, DNA gyrase B-, and HSP90-like ATPase
MAKKTHQRSADTRPTKEVVVDSLTRDATTEACLFDLVDNAIDGARETLERTAGKKELPVDLPESYEGFTIKLTLGADGVRIEDNASGIAADDLEKSVLRFGQRAGRPHGIGFYGVGLNRALFKLGRVIKIDTDDGKSRSILEFDVRDYLKQRGWSRPFDVADTSGKRGTTIVLSNPTTEISQDLADMDWQEALRRDLGRRYHRFLQKHLKIVFQNKSVAPVYVPLRDNSPFPKLQKSYKSGDNVWIHIEAGEHRDHRFPAELAKGQSNPQELTRDFGWSVICNDREILEADRSEKTGWEPTWHNEYNGFVGRVHFISTSPELLPWNTSKTDIDRNNSAYRRALGDMQSFAQKWRQYTRAAKTAKRRGQALPIPAANLPSKPAAPPGRQRVSGSRPHDRSVLPSDIDEGKCGGKLLEIVREGKGVDFFENRYTGLAMLRILFEIASIHFLKRAGLLEKCRTWCITKEEKSRGKPFAVEKRKKYMPGLSILLEFFTEHWSEVIDPAAAAYLDAGFRKFKQFKSEMDNAVHHPFHETNPLRAIDMRDSVVPLLRHLIET